MKWTDRLLDFSLMIMTVGIIIAKDFLEPNILIIILWWIVFWAVIDLRAYLKYKVWGD